MSFNHSSGLPSGNGRRIVLCDSELSYIKRLEEYLAGCGNIPCSTAVYSSREKLLALCDPETVLLLVIAQSQYDSSVPEAGFSSVLILNEQESYMEEENIGKYQPVENIAESIRARCLSDESLTAGRLRHGGPMRRIGVYSPLTRCLQTSFSLCLGQILAKEAPTLYLNFEAYSGFDIMLEQSYRASVSDLLYYNACAKEKMASQISLMTEKIGGLDYLPPMDSFLQLQAIREEEWLSLLDTIEQVTEYGNLVMDLTEHTQGLFTILKGCDVVYTIDREDGFSRAKMLRYEQLLRQENCEEILVRTRRLRMPVFHTLPQRLDLLTKSDLADYVHRMLAGERMA